MTRWAGLKLVVVAILAAMALPLHAQKHVVRFDVQGELPTRWVRPVPVASVNEVPATVNGKLQLLFMEGYLEATIDTCHTVGDTSICLLVPGPRYRWARLSGQGIPVEIASQARFREKLYTGRPVTPTQVARLRNDLLRISENTGYPFATVTLDSLRPEGDGLTATVRLDPGQLVRIDSVVVRGTARTNMRYLQAHIGIRPGDLYNESLIQAAERRVRELPFVSQVRRPYVQFTEHSTKLFLFLDARKASSINGVLGVQPDPVTGNVRLTGDIDLRLRNALKRGEGINLNWRSLQDATQDLRIGFNMPFVFNTPFGTDLGLKLFRRDSTFLEVTTRAGIEHLTSVGDKFTVFLNNKSSERLGRNTVAIPGLADVHLLSYGVGMERNRYDYRFNPRRGHGLQAEASLGRKRTSTAVFTLTEQPPEVRTVQYEVNGQVVGHIPLGRQGTIRLVGQGGWMVNDDLYRNELYRMGGLKTMRGVDEASIYCSSYAIGTFEYRFVFEENSNFFVFFDQGWWEDAAQEQLVTDTPYSVGAGTTFETKAGLFSLTYALGSQFNTGLDLRGGKVHFGFISMF